MMPILHNSFLIFVSECRHNYCKTAFRYTSYKNFKSKLSTVDILAYKQCWDSNEFDEDSPKDEHPKVKDISRKF